MTSPSVSVIVPNYNHAPYLKQRLDSIFNQTFQDFEVIILDDCSTDNSKEIIEEYSNHPQVSHIIYNKTNSGSPFKQWAKGFNLASGEYIWIAESDDWAELNFLKETISILKTNEKLALAFSASNIISDSKQEAPYPFIKSSEIQGTQFIKKRMILDNGIPNASAVLFKKKYLSLICNDYQNFRGAGDCLFWIYLCEQGDIFFLAKKLNNFRIHNNNTTQKCKSDGTVCIEAHIIRNYLFKMGYISNWGTVLLAFKNIERINALNKAHFFSKNVDTKALVHIWKNEIPFYFFKIKITQFFAIIQNLLFKLSIIKEPNNLVFSFFKNRSFLSLIWNMFSMPSFELHKKTGLIKSFFKAYLIQAQYYIKRPLNIFDNWASLGRLDWMPDKWYLSLKFRSIMGYWMDWKNPKTFNEKIQWLKLYDRNPLYTKLVDKFEVRKYIAEKIGTKHLVPLLGVWDNPNDIEFNSLPNQFVLKCTHDSASVIICKDKTKFDIDAAKNKLSKHLLTNYYYASREWPYKKVKPKIIAEKYINLDNDSDLKDYKFQVFNGHVQNCFVCSNRFSDKGLRVTFFDTSWNKLNFSKHYPNDTSLLTKPKFLKEMIFVSEKLAKNIPFIRIDFYETNSNFFIGELTFYPGAGFEKFTPSEWDLKIGSLLKLDKINHINDKI